MALDDSISDEELMVHLQRGDHDAFSILVQRHTDRFYACAFRLCRDPGAAEDIVQEAFLKLWHKPQLWDTAKSKASGAKFTTWFYRVVNNMTLDVLRKKRPIYETERLDYTADDRPAHDEALIQAQQEQALEDVISTLPERQKIAVNLCFSEGLSNKEAAAVLDVGVKALESLLMRAKATIKNELKRKGVIGDGEEKGANTKNMNMKSEETKTKNKGAAHYG